MGAKSCIKNGSFFAYDVWLFYCVNCFSNKSQQHSNLLLGLQAATRWISLHYIFIFLVLSTYHFIIVTIIIMRPGSTFTSAAIAFTAAFFLYAANNAVVVEALDVEISSYECDASYPVTANIYMECANGSGRCTFGELITVYGDRTCIIMMLNLLLDEIIQ